MKSIHSSLYRVRSNSLTSSHRTLHTNNVVPLNFQFDSPPTSLRPGILTSVKSVSPEPSNSGSSTQQSSHSHTGHPSYSLALGTTPTSNSSHLQSQYALFPYSSSPPKPHSQICHPPSSHEHPRLPKRQKLKYHLDVGAYGIPKKSKSASSHRGLHTRASTPTPTSDDLNLAVQVGEDAYFISDNAMGVADGVGGWSKSKNHQDVSQPSPSALFARRLMHFCSAEVETVTSSRPRIPTAARRPHSKFTFQHNLKPRSAPVPIIAPTSPWSWNEAEEIRLRREELEEDLEDSLEELSEGIDVLQILERAYDTTIKAHVVPSSDPNTSSGSSTYKQQSSGPSLFQPSNKTCDTVPLLSGSSTALVAVLDQPSRQSSPAESSSPSVSPVVSPDSSSTPLPKPIVNYAAGTLHPSISLDRDGAESCDAVVRIAHIGDCMGMLVRGEEIVWRSEEMWWDFNMPLQLGPATHPTVTPSTSAHYFTLPVRADDILILASDGLSDNLWDEDILDEVVKFRRSFLGVPTSTEFTPTKLDAAFSTSDTPASPIWSSDKEGDQLLRRKALAGMLSEALCSRARKVSERRWDKKAAPAGKSEEDDEVPFARRAREAGKFFRGGKFDDISVIVAVISPSHGGEVKIDSQT